MYFRFLLMMTRLCVAAWLGPPLATLRYLMYFRFLLMTVWLCVAAWLYPPLAALQYVVYFRFMDIVVFVHNGQEGDAYTQSDTCLCSND